MADDQKKDGWFQYVVDIVRQITTPIAAFVVLAALATHMGSVIAGSEITEPWRGWLLIIILAVFAAITFALIVMTIFYPQNLTFDKDSHIVIFNLKANEAVGANQLINDLIEASRDPAKLNDLASRMSPPLADDNEGQDEDESKSEEEDDDDEGYAGGGVRIPGR
jgi:hypothetical protein